MDFLCELPSSTEIDLAIRLFLVPLELRDSRLQLPYRCRRGLGRSTFERKGHCKRPCICTPSPVESGLSKEVVHLISISSLSQRCRLSISGGSCIFRVVP